MNNTLLLSIGDVILLTSVPALALFVGFYYARSPWRQLMVGRSLMYFALSLILVVVTVSLSLWFGSAYPGREYVRIVAYSLVSAMTWRLFFTLRYIQKQPIPADIVTATNSEKIDSEN